jgi:hypothetical protein
MGNLGVSGSTGLTTTGAGGGGAGGAGGGAGGGVLQPTSQRLVLNTAAPNRARVVFEKESVAI